MADDTAVLGQGDVHGEWHVHGIKVQPERTVTSTTVEVLSSGPASTRNATREETVAGDGWKEESPENMSGDLDVQPEVDLTGHIAIGSTVVGHFATNSQVIDDAAAKSVPLRLRHVASGREVDLSPEIDRMLQRDAENQSVQASDPDDRAGESALDAGVVRDIDEYTDVQRAAYAKRDRARVALKRRKTEHGKLLPRQLHVERVNADAAVDAQRDHEEEREEAERQRPRERAEQYGLPPQEPFVYRHGAFAQRYVESGLTRSLDESASQCLRRFKQRWRSNDPPTLSDPVEDDHFRAFDPQRDVGEVVQLRLRDWKVIVGLLYSYSWIVLLATGYTSVMWWFGTWPLVLQSPLLIVGVLVLLGWFCTVEERYADGDWMIECQQPVLDAVEADDDMDNRMPSQRDTKVTHQGVYYRIAYHEYIVAATSNLLSRGFLRTMGPFYYFWNFERFFKLRIFVREKVIEWITCSHLLHALSTSSCRTYAEALSHCRITAARIATVNVPSYRVGVIEDTCRYAAMVFCRRPREDFVPEAPPPF